MKAELHSHVLRLRPGQEIKSSLAQYVEDYNIAAAFVLTCVGSVTRARLRLAHPANEVVTLNAHYEIVSLVGTLSKEGAHLHISLADDKGCVTGGHVLGDLIVFTTAEIVLGECCYLKFARELDPATGCRELVVSLV